MKDYFVVVLKDGAIIFQNRTIEPLIVNFITAASAIGERLFSQTLSSIKYHDYVISIEKIKDNVLVVGSREQVNIKEVEMEIKNQVKL